MKIKYFILTLFFLVFPFFGFADTILEDFEYYDTMTELSDDLSVPEIPFKWSSVASPGYVAYDVVRNTQVGYFNNEYIYPSGDYEGQRARSGHFDFLESGQTNEGYFEIEQHKINSFNRSQVQFQNESSLYRDLFLFTSLYKSSTDFEFVLYHRDADDNLDSISLTETAQYDLKYFVSYRTRWNDDTSALQYEFKMWDEEGNDITDGYIGWFNARSGSNIYDYYDGVENIKRIFFDTGATIGNSFSIDNISNSDLLEPDFLLPDLSGFGLSSSNSFAYPADSWDWYDYNASTTYFHYGIWFSIHNPEEKEELYIRILDDSKNVLSTTTFSTPAMCNQTYYICNMYQNWPMRLFDSLDTGLDWSAGDYYFETFLCNIGGENCTNPAEFPFELNANLDSSAYVSFEDSGWDLSKSLIEQAEQSSRFDFVGNAIRQYFDKIKDRFPFSWIWGLYSLWNEKKDEYAGQSGSAFVIEFTVPEGVAMAGESIPLVDFEMAESEFGTSISLFRVILGYTIWLSVIIVIYNKTRKFIMNLKEED